MEKKFESELGKRIVEGKRRKSTKKVVLVIAAVSVMTLLVGAASFTMAQMACAGNSPVVDEAVLFESKEDSIMSTENILDTAAKRVMNLKYRSSDPLSDAIDLGQTKFSYAVNVQFKEVVEDIGFGTAVGNLLIDFEADVADDLVTILGSATVYDSEGNIVTSVDNLVIEDMNEAADMIDVTAAIPTFEGSLGAGYSVSINIQITIDDTPGLSGTVTEQPWPTQFTESYVDETTVIDYDFDSRSADFPVDE